MPMWAVEANCFRGAGVIDKATGVLAIPGGLTKMEHFINLSNTFWGHRDAKEKFIWHPWAEDMLEACCEHKYVGFAGSGSSGKSAFMAVWAMGNWLCQPYKTLALLTSTTIRDAKMRVWGAVHRYYYSGVHQIGISKMVTSPTPAIHTIKDGAVMLDAGLQLIPAEARKTSEVTGKMRGVKQKRVFLCADELSELSQALLDTAKSNLSNADIFHMTAAANPKSYMDPFGVFVKPVDGWNSITVDDTQWAIEGGVCLHFDALKNPNFLARENLWPIQKYEKVDDALAREGAIESPGFWRDFRAFWCPLGFEASIYSESEILQFNGMDKAEWSGARKEAVAGFDPNYSGGDRAVLRVGYFGTSADGQDQIEFGPSFDVEEDLSDKKTARNFQIARKLIALLKEHNVPLSNLGVDATAGGNIFCDILANEAGSDSFLRVQFGAKATTRAVSNLDPTPANEKYKNRVTELWCVGLEYLRAGQFRGIDNILVQELTERRYETTRATSVTLMTVEPKIRMKARTGKSPDNADASVLLIDVCRERFGLQSEDGRSVHGSAASGSHVWRNAFSRMKPLKRSMNNRR